MADINKAQELDLYHQWKKKQDKDSFQALYKTMKPLITDASKRAAYGSNIPYSAHHVYAARNFLDALRTYNPTGGASLQTHVFGAVQQKAKRLNYLFQNIGSMPEPRAQIVGEYQNEVGNLRASLGREPSTAEVADRMGIGLKEVANLHKEIRKDLALDEGTEEMPYFESSRDEEILEYLYYELMPEEKIVYEYLFGKHGRIKMTKFNGKVDFDGIASRMGISASKVRSLHDRIRQKLDKALKK